MLLYSHGTTAAKLACNIASPANGEAAPLAALNAAQGFIVVTSEPRLATTPLRPPYHPSPPMRRTAVRTTWSTRCSAARKCVPEHRRRAMTWQAAPPSGYSRKAVTSRWPRTVRCR